jgi:uncharacterized protein (TIGR00266 family)
MKYDLQGTTMQLLNVQLAQGENIYSESGRLVYMSDNVQMQTEAKGGLWAGLKRKFAGESFFLVTFTSKSGTGVIGFGSEFPGKIIPLKLRKGEEIIAQKDAFLVAEESVTMDGLILIKVKGHGLVFFNVGGEISQVKLEAGQKIRVDTSNLAMFDASVQYSVERVKGVKNIIWGGEGLFLATCVGPGRVWVQSMPVSELAGKLAEYMTHRGGRGGGVVAGMALGSMMARR